MHEKFISCIECGKKYPPDSKIFLCECGGTLEFVFDYSKIRKGFRERISKRVFNHSRYVELYPISKLVSIQEGGTPLVRSRNIEKEFGLGFELYFKYEAQNPTGSFKDRGSSVEVAKAVEHGAKEAICASTGNMGASLSAYTAMADIRLSVLTPGDARAVKLEQMLACGADVYRINGDYTKAARFAERINMKTGSYLLGDYLHRREGTKSVGFEICEQLKGVDYITTPVGNGTLISATWKAINEFKELGIIRKRPRMVGIQAATCSTVARAYRRGLHIIPIRNPRTIAGAIECGDPIDGKNALEAIRNSGGFADSVSDAEILKAREILARREGLFAEPAGAVSLAGILKARAEISKGSRVVCIVTGHGLKTPRTGVRGSVRTSLNNKFLKALGS